MSGIRKSRKTSSRTSTRISSADRIDLFGFPANPSCRRCSQKNFLCTCLRDGRCSECVRSDVEKGCDAKMSSRTDKVLKEQEQALRKAQADVAAASAKMAEASARMLRYQKIVDNLKKRGLKELDEMMLEIERENEQNSNEGGESSESISGGQENSNVSNNAELSKSAVGLRR